MADKLGLGSDIKELRLGSSFTNPRGSAFHTFRYDFKPASVDTTKMATVDILPNNEVNVTVPHSDGSGTSQTSVFRGPKKPYAKECVLIIDHTTGEVTLERLSHNIQLKKTRLESSGKGHSASPIDPSNVVSYGVNSKRSPQVQNSPSVSPASTSPPYCGASPAKISPKHVNSTGQVKRMKNNVSPHQLPNSSSESDSTSESSASDSDSDVANHQMSTKQDSRTNVAACKKESMLDTHSMTHLSMPSHLLSEDLRLSDSGSESD
nr:EOG090X0IV9 [Macrothrix elegans]